VFYFYSILFSHGWDGKKTNKSIAGNKKKAVGKNNFFQVRRYGFSLFLF
jgi:hypothetical protein